MKLLFINGVNLNLTGKRETGVYGSKTLEEINKVIAREISVQNFKAPYVTV